MLTLTLPLHFQYSCSSPASLRRPKNQWHHRMPQVSSTHLRQRQYLQRMRQRREIQALIPRHETAEWWSNQIPMVSSSRANCTSSECSHDCTHPRTRAPRATTLTCAPIICAKKGCCERHAFCKHVVHRPYKHFFIHVYVQWCV